MKKTMNLYKKHRQIKRNKRGRKQSSSVYYLLLLGFVLILGAYGGKLFLDLKQQEEERKSLLAYTTQSDVVARYEQANKLSQDISTLDSLKNALTEIQSVFSEKQSIGDRVLLDINDAKPESVTIRSIEIKGSDVVVVFESTSKEEFPTFVEAMSKKEIVKAVKYDGFKTLQSSDTYEATMKIVLKGGF